MVDLFQNFLCQSNSAEVRYIFVYIYIYIYYIYLIYCNMQCKPYITVEVEVSKLFQ